MGLKACIRPIERIRIDDLNSRNLEMMKNEARNTQMRNNELMNNELYYSEMNNSVPNNNVLQNNASKNYESRNNEPKYNEPRYYELSNNESSSNKSRNNESRNNDTESGINHSVSTEEQSKNIIDNRLQQSVLDKNPSEFSEDKKVDYSEPQLIMFRGDYIPEKEEIDNKDIIKEKNEPPSERIDYSNKTEPKFVMYRGDYLPDKDEFVNKNIVKKKSGSSSDEEEIKMISRPKKTINDDDLHGVIPIVSAREKPAAQRISFIKQATLEGKLENKDFSIEKKQSLPVKVEENNKGTGICDMYNEINNLGLEDVEIRPLNISKNKVSKTPIPSKAKEDSKIINEWSDDSVRLPTKTTSSFISVEKAINLSAQVDSKGNSLSNNEKKNTLSGISVRSHARKTPIKSQYIEKPEIVPDDPEMVNNKSPIQTRNRPDPVNNRIKKPQSEFKEVPHQIKPQGNDKDWDNWDDQ